MSILLRHLNFFILSLSIITNSTYSMLTTWKHEPITQTPCIEIMLERFLLNKLPAEHAPFIYPTISIKGYVTSEEIPGRCFDYAIKQITKIPKDFIIGIMNNTATLSIEKFFVQTEEPSENDLVIYTKNKDLRIITHYAVVIKKSPLLLRSKWGFEPAILEHGLFQLPKPQGSSAGFFTLKEEFKTDEGQKLLIQWVEEDIEMYKKNYPRYYDALLDERNNIMSSPKIQRLLGVRGVQ